MPRLETSALHPTPCTNRPLHRAHGSRPASLLVSVALVLAACGTTPEDRGISGAGLGAAGGAIIGAVTGLSVLEGALIGTAAGGAVGLLTDKDRFNLGDPIWKGKGGGSPQAAASGGARDVQIAEIQGNLARLGYRPGPSDGVVGPQTLTAVREYQRDNGLPEDGRLTEDVARHIAQRADTCKTAAC